jgi:hypothetical protein
MIKKISLQEFYSQLKIVRETNGNSKKIRWLGQFKINDKTFNDLFELNIEDYENDMEYLDNFAKDQIANKILKKIRKE